MDAQTILFTRAPKVKADYDADPTRVTACLALATEEVEDDGWVKRQKAIALLAWHYYLEGSRDLAGTAITGQVLERQLDNGRTKYADTSKAHGDGRHGSTAPGAEYDRLISTRWVLPGFP